MIPVSIQPYIGKTFACANELLSDSGQLYNVFSLARTTLETAALLFQKTIGQTFIGKAKTVCRLLDVTALPSDISDLSNEKETFKIAALITSIAVDILDLGVFAYEMGLLSSKKIQLVLNQIPMAKIVAKAALGPIVEVGSATSSFFSAISALKKCSDSSDPVQKKQALLSVAENVAYIGLSILILASSGQPIILAFKALSTTLSISVFLYKKHSVDDKTTTRS
jgi:hypothetical protein